MRHKWDYLINIIDLEMDSSDQFVIILVQAFAGGLHLAQRNHFLHLDFCGLICYTNFINVVNKYTSSKATISSKN